MSIYLDSKFNYTATLTAPLCLQILSGLTTGLLANEIQELGGGVNFATKFACGRFFKNHLRYGVHETFDSWASPWRIG